MIAAARVDDAEDILRYIPPRLIREDGGVDGAAFLPRDTDGDGTSVHRALFYDPEISVSLEEIKRRFRCRRAKTGAFAEANVGSFRFCVESVAEVGVLDVFEDPLEKEDPFEEDPAHALLTGLPFRGLMDELVILLIEQAVKRPLHPSA
jgi:hypothetical protein